MFFRRDWECVILLRSITKHVKDQNWFAVFLDFFIVVAGILIALQITNWNEGRSERALEAVYTERLHQEVIDLEAVRKNRINGRLAALNGLRSATQKLMNLGGDRLTSIECYSLIESPMTSNPTDELPLIIELLSSGRFSIFSNEDLEKALGDYLNTRNRARDSRLGIAANIPNLDEKYQHFYQIRGSLVKNADVPFPEFFASLPITCDEDGMRASQVYLNDLALFESKYNNHVQDNSRVSTALAELHSVLDEILSVKHGEEK